MNRKWRRRPDVINRMDVRKKKKIIANHLNFNHYYSSISILINLIEFNGIFQNKIINSIKIEIIIHFLF